MEFTDVINGRYSCRKFDGRRIEAGHPEAIPEA